MDIKNSLTIDLNEFIDIFDMPDTFLHFANKKTGKIVTVERSDLSYFEDGEDEDGEDDDDTFEEYPEWQREALLLAKEIYTSDDYLELLSLESCEEYEMIEEFCDSMESSRIKDKLLDAIQVKGAFGRFKTTLYNFDIEKTWDLYRHQCLKNLAAEWCENQGFAYKYKLPPYLRHK